MPITISFEAKTQEDLRTWVGILNAMVNPPEAREKTLADFSLMDIHEYWKANQTSPAPAEANPTFSPGGIVETKAEPEAPAKAPRKAKTPKTPAVVADTAPDTVQPVAVPVDAPAPVAEPAPSDHELKAKAIKLIMDVYAVPLGKKLSNELLKDYGVRNFNLIPDEQASELLAKVKAGIKAAGL